MATRYIKPIMNGYDSNGNGYVTVKLESMYTGDLSDNLFWFIQLKGSSEVISSKIAPNSESVTFDGLELNTVYSVTVSQYENFKIGDILAQDTVAAGVVIEIISISTNTVKYRLNGLDMSYEDNGINKMRSFSTVVFIGDMSGEVYDSSLTKEIPYAVMTSDVVTFSQYSHNGQLTSLQPSVEYELAVIIQMSDGSVVKILNTKFTTSSIGGGEFDYTANIQIELNSDGKIVATLISNGNPQGIHWYDLDHYGDETHIDNSNGKTSIVLNFTLWSKKYHMPQGVRVYALNNLGISDVLVETSLLIPMFVWKTEKIKGKKFNLTAEEWNNINIYYKRWYDEDYSVTTVQSGQTFTADMYNNLFEKLVSTANFNADSAISYTTMPEINERTAVSAIRLNNLVDLVNAKVEDYWRDSFGGENTFVYPNETYIF